MPVLIKRQPVYPRDRTERQREASSKDPFSTVSQLDPAEGVGQQAERVKEVKEVPLTCRVKSKLALSPLWKRNTPFARDQPCFQLRDKSMGIRVSRRDPSGSTTGQIVTGWRNASRNDTARSYSAYGNYITPPSATSSVGEDRVALRYAYVTLSIANRSKITRRCRSIVNYWSHDACYGIISPCGIKDTHTRKRVSNGASKIVEQRQPKRKPLFPSDRLPNESGSYRRFPRSITRTRLRWRSLAPIDRWLLRYCLVSRNAILPIPRVAPPVSDRRLKFRSRSRPRKTDAASQDAFLAGNVVRISLATIL